MIPQPMILIVHARHGRRAAATDSKRLPLKDLFLPETGSMFLPTAISTFSAWELRAGDRRSRLGDRCRLRIGHDPHPPNPRPDLDTRRCHLEHRESRRTGVRASGEARRTRRVRHGVYAGKRGRLTWGFALVDGPPDGHFGRYYKVEFPGDPKPIWIREHCVYGHCRNSTWHIELWYYEDR